MARHGEPVSTGDESLELFDFPIFEFHDISAPRAEEVVVMTRPDRLFVVATPLLKVPLGDQATVHQQRQGPVDGGRTDLRAPSPDLPKELLRREMLPGFEDDAGDLHSRVCEWQATVAQELLESCQGVRDVCHEDSVENDSQSISFGALCQPPLPAAWHRREPGLWIDQGSQGRPSPRLEVAGGWLLVWREDPPWPEIEYDGEEAIKGLDEIS